MNSSLSLVILNYFSNHLGFPDSSVGKESTCNAGDYISFSGLGRLAGEGVDYALQYSWTCGSAGKESTCNVGELGLISELGRSSGEVNSYTLQYSGLENSMGYTVTISTRRKCTDKCKEVSAQSEGS